MPACKTCSEWFAKTRENMELCCKCEMALSRLTGYVLPLPMLFLFKTSSSFAMNCMKTTPS